MELNPKNLPQVKVNKTEELVYSELYETYGDNNPFVVVYPNQDKEVCYYENNQHLLGTTYWNTGETGNFSVSLNNNFEPVSTSSGF